MDLNLVIPELGDIPLHAYYYLRIACCAHLMVRGGTTLIDCDRCHLNRGYVCPTCLGATWVSSTFYGHHMTRCPTCTQDNIGEKGELASHYDSDKETLAVRAWVAHNFPYGIPWPMTEQDVLRADG